jgi:peptidoglycan/LPS O-acetylase OafA/YrhL
MLIVPQHVAGAGWQWPDIDAGLVRVIYCFFAGVFIFRLRAVVRIPAIPAWLAFAVYLAIIGCPTPDAWRSAYNVAATLVFMPLLVAFAAGARVSGWAARLCVLMGMLSYGVYVVHVPIFKILSLAAVHLPFETPGYAMVLVVALTAGVVTWVADKYYDVPARVWLSQKFSRSKRLVLSAGRRG